MAVKWRLLDTGALDAANNMALEKVLLDSCVGGARLNTLHLLEFKPCVLLGYSQVLSDEVNEDFCMENGIEINRRISGGGCIYMDAGTLGWEIIAKKGEQGIPGNLQDMYGKLCGGVVLALSSYGIEASYRPLNDVEVRGRKISGTGGAEQGDSFIFHGTILVDFNAEIMAGALKMPVKKQRYKHLSGFMTRTVCMRELLGCAPPIFEVKARLVDAFAEILDTEFEPSGLTQAERDALDVELPLFRSPEWVNYR